MAKSKILLARDEEVVLHIRTHLKAMAVPTLWLFLMAGVYGVGLAVLPAGWNPWGIYVLTGLFAIGVIWLWLLPYLRWFTETFTVTTRRIVTRKGILHRTGQDLPLRSINSVDSDSSFFDRILKCGTLVLETAAENPLTLKDVPQVEQVKGVINDLIYDGDLDDA